IDVVTVAGTAGNDAFTVSPADALDGRVALAGYPFIDYSALGTGAGAVHSTVALFGDVNAGATNETDTVAVVGTTGADAYSYTPLTTESGLLGLTTGGISVSFSLSGISGLSV